MLQRPTERPTQISLISDDEGEQESDGDAEKEDDTVDSPETKPAQVHLGFDSWLSVNYWNLLCYGGGEVNRTLKENKKISS